MAYPEGLICEEDTIGRTGLAAGTPLVVDQPNPATTAADRSHSGAHGLTAAPSFVVARAECKVADRSFAVGDVVELTGQADGFSVYFDADNVYVNFQADGVWLTAKGGGTGSAARMDERDWEFTFTPYLATDASGLRAGVGISLTPQSDGTTLITNTNVPTVAPAAPVVYFGINPDSDDYTAAEYLEAMGGTPEEGLNGIAGLGSQFTTGVYAEPIGIGYFALVAPWARMDVEFWTPGFINTNHNDSLTIVGMLELGGVMRTVYRIRDFAGQWAERTYQLVLPS